MYYVWQCNKDNPIKLDGEFNTVDDAWNHAKTVDVKTTEPVAMKVTDDKGNVAKWVSRNGYKPSGALPPDETRRTQCFPRTK